MLDPATLHIAGGFRCSQAAVRAAGTRQSAP